MVDGGGQSPMPADPCMGTARQPVLLERSFVEKSIGAAMADKAIVGSFFRGRSPRAEVAHGVAPAMGEEVAQSQGIHLLGPDPVGVRPGSRWIKGSQGSHANPQRSQFSRDGEGRWPGADHEDITTPSLPDLISLHAFSPTSLFHPLLLRFRAPVARPGPSPVARKPYLRAPPQANRCHPDRLPKALPRRVNPPDRLRSLSRPPPVAPTPPP